MPMVAAAVAENSSGGSSTDSDSELKVSAPPSVGQLWREQHRLGQRVEGKRPSLWREQHRLGQRVEGKRPSLCRSALEGAAQTRTAS